MLTQDIAKIEGAVIALCPDVEAIQCNRSPACLNERQHWAELICCLLSSQVPYESAVTATKIIKERKLLPCDNIECYKQYEENLSDLLKQPIFDGRRYRFPALRAKQISNTGEEFAEKVTTIKRLLNELADIHDTRKAIIEMVHGFGPKQTSMYLRNIGFTNKLAILDRHVVRFMHMVGLAERDVVPQTLSKYETLESHFTVYSRDLGFSPACVDYATWVVMRVNTGRLST